MTPREKAEEITLVYYNLGKHLYVPISFAKQCALIAVDENLKILKQVLDESTNIYQSLNTPKRLCIDVLNPLLKYWQEVKQEIENL